MKAMPSGNLRQRLQLLYAAVGAAVTRDVERVPGRLLVTNQARHCVQDFSMGKSSAQIANAAQLLIYNIAHLKDHLKRWGEQHGKEPREVEEQINRTPALQIVVDLSNIDKHGEASKHRRYDKPIELRNVRNILRLSAGGGAPGAAGLLGEKVVTSGAGNATVLLTGEIVDEQGDLVGGLDRVADEAVQAWEEFMQRYGCIQG
jgi:hypothetical protein